MVGDARGAIDCVVDGIDARGAKLTIVSNAISAVVLSLLPLLCNPRRFVAWIDFRVRVAGISSE